MFFKSFEENLNYTKKKIEVLEIELKELYRERAWHNQTCNTLNVKNNSNIDDDIKEKENEIKELKNNLENILIAIKWENMRNEISKLEFLKLYVDATFNKATDYVCDYRVRICAECYGSDIEYNFDDKLFSEYLEKEIKAKNELLNKENI